MFFKKLLARAFNKRGTNPDNHVTSLKAGDKAPAIAGILQDGKKFDSNSVKGKKVVLYFYPKDDTAGCTMQACSLRDNYELMQKQGYEIIGVSADSAEKHQDFIKKYSLPFPLIADMDHKLINAYDVWGKKSLLGKSFTGIVRTTFVINEQGIIDEVISDVDTVGHADQILKK
jgi:peroxiredoxin Q/BCP